MAQHPYPYDNAFKFQISEHTQILIGKAIVHIEVQTGDSRKPMWARLSRYIGYLIGTHELLVYCSVLYLRPGAGLNETGRYHYKAGGYEYLLGYKAIRLVEVERQPVREGLFIGI